VKINSFIEPFPYLVVDNLFTDDEYDSMVSEWIALEQFAARPEETRSALNNGEILKSGKGVFLDTMFSANRNASNTLTTNRKLFDSAFLEEVEKLNPAFSLLRASSVDSTLVSYYGDGDYYGKHYDYSTITAITYFLSQDNLLGGGELIFNDYNVEVVPQNNRTVIFISSIWHEVKPIKGADGCLRIAMTQFIGNWRN